MSDVAQHPSFPETEVKLAKENTIQQIRGGRADPGFLVNERFQKAVFGNHPYSFVVPDEKSISALTRNDLRLCHQLLHSEYSHLIVVGDIDADKTFAEIEKAFGSWKAAQFRRTRSASSHARQTADLLRQSARVRFNRRSTSATSASHAKTKTTSRFARPIRSTAARSSRA